MHLQIQGHIRILIVSAVSRDEENIDEDDEFDAICGILLHASIDVSFDGLAVTAIDDTPCELFNLGTIIFNFPIPNIYCLFM